jgi:glycosyltransferase involved in cell wall biosynthesis
LKYLYQVKFLFLYTEIADYFLACCQELSVKGEVHVIRYPVNKEAPFQFNHATSVKLYNRNDFSYQQLQKFSKDLKPDIIICSGWIDNDYLKLCKTYFKKVPTVLTCDTHWRGDLKQKIATVLSRFTLLRIFSNAWVPGLAQKQYVEKLGFKEQQINLGFYSCNHAKFNAAYIQTKKEKEFAFPRRFIYVGRYYEFKGLKELWQAFIELQDEQPNDWELWCLGTGDLKPVEHPKIKHFGFVQPLELNQFIKESGVFVLPSRFEPWGVVVHEFAAAGFPLLLSDAVGAKEQFLKIGQNGFSFKENSVSQLKSALTKYIQLSNQDLVKMAQVSNELSKSITPETWVKTISKILKAK